MPAISAIFTEKYTTSIQNPPQTLEGHINHENGIVNDYRGRAIYEFFQNAIDRASQNIWIRLDTVKQQLIIANDGEPFSIERVGNQRYSDFSAVCSINTSSKNQNESIGNKGVGFKSCWEYTDQVTVISEHGDEKVRWGFKLSNPLTADKLATWAQSEEKILHWLRSDDVQSVIGDKGKGKIPSFYFPQRLIKLPEKPDGMDSAVTVITFDELKPSKLEELKFKINEFAQHQIFFVKQLSSLSGKNITLTLQIDNELIETLNTEPVAEDWLIVSKEFKGEALDALHQASDTLNYHVEKPKVAIAFPLRADLLGSDPSPNSEVDQFKEEGPSKLVQSLFYCYLPTQECAGFNVLIHGDFLLDVSRKQIDFQDNAYNNLLLGHAADLFVQTLLDDKTLHQLPFFAKFLMLNGANGLLKEQVEKKLLPLLPEILKKVYTRQREWDSSAYTQVFDAISSWESEHLPGEWNSTTLARSKDRIKNFCGQGIYIVPILDEVKPRSYTYLPEIKNADDANTTRLFFRSKDQLEASNLQVDLLKGVPNLAISSFQPLDQQILNELRIVRKFSTLSLVTALAMAVEKDGCYKAEILEFCCQLAKAEKPIVRSDFFNNDHVGKQFGRILLPCTDGSWHPALQCYAHIEDEIAQAFDTNQFFKVDIAEFQKLAANTDTNALLKIFGVWVRCLPLSPKLDALAWGDSPPQTQKLKQLVNDSIKEWGHLDGMGAIKQLLLTQAWVSDDAQQGPAQCPRDVFLYDKSDYRKISCICKEQEKPGLEDLYRYLDIRKIEDTSDIQKILRQLQKMSSLDPNENVHVATYKSLIKRLAQLRAESLDSLELKLMPVLVQTLAGVLTYTQDRVDVRYIPAEQKRYKFHFRDCRFVCFDDDTSKTFVDELNIKTLAPRFVISYRDENDQSVSAVLDEDFKRKFEASIYLASLFAVAESKLGSKFHRDDTVDRWQRLAVYKADNVVMTIDDVDHQSLIEKNSDVLYKPPSDSQRSGDKTVVGELAHDLIDPLGNSAISKFGPAIAEAVFRDMSLGNLFAVYLTKCFVSQNYQNSGDGGNSKAREDFLHNEGLSEQDIAAMHAYINERLLSEESIEILLQALQKLTGATHLTKENFRELQHYKKLKMTTQELMAELNLGEKYRSTLSQIDPFLVNQKSLKNHFIDLQLLIDFHKSQNQGVELPNTPEEIFRSVQPLLNRHDFTLYLVLDHFKISANVSAFELEKFRIKRDHGLPIDAFKNVEPRAAQNIEPEGPKEIATVKVFNSEEKVHQEEGQRKRGIGTELLLCHECAHDFFEQHSDKLDALITALASVVSAENIQPQNIKDVYLKKLNEQRTKITPQSLTTLLHASKIIGDGLGYDIFIPEVQGSLVSILKVEVKSGGNKIYLSDSERRRVLYFAESKNENWRLWLNHKGNDKTEAVKKAVTDHQQSLVATGDVPLFADTWYMLF